MKQKKNFSALLGYLVLVALGGACGVLFALSFEKSGAYDLPLPQLLFRAALLLIGLYAAVFVVTILHEGGHLVGGLATGYRFSSFRIGRLMLVRENGQLRFRRFSLAGTGGQCLMSPPALIDGKMPYILYNLGGPLANLLCAAVFAGLSVACAGQVYAALAFRVLALFSLVFGLANGLPLRLGVDTDGRNALSLGKNPAALRAFWVQMRMNAALSQGQPLSSMPVEWFTLPSDEELKNALCAALAVFAENRRMAENRLADAAALIDTLLEKDTALVPLHRRLLICDRIFCELLGAAPDARRAQLLDAPQKKLMAQMKRFPAVLRTEYALARLDAHDNAKAQRLRAAFEKVGKTYPYPADFETERQLMALVDRAAEAAAQ